MTIYARRSAHSSQVLSTCCNIAGCTTNADLKPENFLLKDRTGSIAKDNLRAIDFGLSCIHHDGNLKQIVGSGERNSSASCSALCTSCACGS
jgi:hypothetical protein